MQNVCYKVSLCENFQRQSCKAFTGLYIRAPMVVGQRPLKPLSHCHGLDAGSVTVLIRDYPWDIRPGSVDMTVMFRGQPSHFRRLGFSVARFSTCSKISFLP